VKHLEILFMCGFQVPEFCVEIGKLRESSGEDASAGDVPSIY
jgi:hypothetical protein